MEGEDWQAARSLLTLSETIQSATQRQHASAGLVAMSARPSTYPYSFTRELELTSTAQPQTPILTSISAQREREKVGTPCFVKVIINKIQVESFRSIDFSQVYSSFWI